MQESLPAPTAHLILRLAAEFDADRYYRASEQALEWLFAEQPTNDQLAPVLLKVVALNRLYSTQVFAVFDVARHIVSLDIDAPLARGDPAVVERMANVTLGGKARRIYSFASKYCSWHRPDVYPILDSVVKELLWRYRGIVGGPPIRRAGLDNYSGFCGALDAFIGHFALGDVDRKTIDKGLWMLGRSLGS